MKLCILILKQAGRQASKPAGRQAGRQAGGQADFPLTCSAGEITELESDSVPSVLQYGQGFCQSLAEETLTIDCHHPVPNLQGTSPAVHTYRATNRVQTITAHKMDA